MQYTEAKYQSLFDELCFAAWKNAGIKEQDTIVAAAQDEELHLTYVSALGFHGEDGFDINVWDEQIDNAFSGLALWFIGLSIPFVTTDVFGRQKAIIVVVGMNRMKTTMASIKLKKTADDIVPVKWQAIRMFSPLDTLMPALRRHVTLQG